jgi:serine/threonine protein kinase
MDFGLTVFADKTGSFDGTFEVGAQPWMAPELLDPQKMGLESFQRTFASDIYAFACVCVEVSAVPVRADWNNLLCYIGSFIRRKYLSVS